MKKLFLMFSIALFSAGCAGGGNSDSNGSTEQSAADETKTPGTEAYDPKRGEGKFTEVKISDKLDAEMAARGEKVADLKCISCHKLTDEKLVGPGWAGVTKRHTPEWIMNFMTNTDAMIDKDPKVQAMLEICMVRMPNQNLSDGDTRDILEFLRKNDGVK
ncbi:c-type cytochrome [Pedobacter nyackensis]|uniref:Cytochrome c n=1 Tax=Pedobacter nyackensis TaxID=475255 RepID=A0A1W2DW03_9SPHI|nr:cytochrome c [Pedobacter nyackensis]SMD01613.1 Cytochrome c [Pedobacter nyackensis]